MKATFTLSVFEILQLKNLIYPERLVTKKSPLKASNFVNISCDYEINQIVPEILEIGKFFFSLFYSLKLMTENYKSTTSQQMYLKLRLSVMS